MSRSQQTRNSGVAWQRMATLYFLVAIALPGGLLAGETGVFTFAHFPSGNPMTDTTVGISTTKTYQNTSNINGVAQAFRKPLL